MKRYELAVIGAGPSGLSAAIEAASHGMEVAVFDENARPGGQLFKQIHKFFGSKEHKAKTRGFNIGEDLLAEAERTGVRVSLNSVVMGIYDCNELNVKIDDEVHHLRADNIIIATGASENMIPFDGWTLPGVIGAGAAQTLMNLHGVQPGEKVLMVGSGNVGLVVGYQLLQAGCKLQAVIDAAPRIGGYGVHAAKLARAGVPFLTSHTVVKALGSDCVTGAVVAKVDEKFSPVPGSEINFDVDTICIAVGLSPMSQLARVAGCDTTETRFSGGVVPKVDECGATSLSGIFAAGDVSGIEEASSAMIGGRIAGAAAARRAGYLSDEQFDEISSKLRASLSQLREGMFSHENKGRADLTATDEGIPISKNLLTHGYPLLSELEAFPAFSHSKGVHPVIECTQNIPCNPCQDACHFGCIKVGERISNLPVLGEGHCTGCGACVASCPGQAIFLVNEDFDADCATVTMPYELLPLPSVGDIGQALDRSGKPVGKAEVVSLKTSASMDCTYLLTIKVAKELAMTARFFAAEGGKSDE